MVQGGKERSGTDWYSSKRWKEKRKHILFRDKWKDQVALRDGVTIEATVVHHILPREEYPQYAWCDWNLISVSQETHKKRLHEKYTGKLTKLGKALMYETAAKNNIPLKSLTMVIGLPGSGKSTWVKRHLEGGLVYDLDYISAAFRLAKPHEENHGAARRMAAALRKGFIASASEYTNNVFVIRSAPSVEEITETNPDRIIVCERLYKPERCPKPSEVDNLLARIKEAVLWASSNGKEVVYYPPRGG